MNTRRRWSPWWIMMASVGLLGAATVASCSDDIAEESPPDACTDPPCGDECADPPCDEQCANPPCDEECAEPPCDEECAEPPCDEECAEPPCDPTELAFVHVPITIDDPIANGTSLMTPVDGVSYAHDGQGTFVTAFGRDFNDPSQTFLWHLNEATGTHEKKALSGQVFAASANLCVGEDWCQFIGYDSGDWLIVGAAADNMMRVSNGFVSTLTPVTGPRPASSFISHSHVFTSGELYLFGATGPSGFSDTVFSLGFAGATWTAAATGLPQTDDNCLAFDRTRDTLYSVAGRTTTDGGDTTQTLATLTSIDISLGTFTVSDLPAEMGARRRMSCAYDEGRGRLYAFGGAAINDNFDDAQNELFNDLWAYDVGTGTWTNLIAKTAGGVLGEPDMYGDQRFEGEPSGPNFGRNRGLMQLDTMGNRLLLIGSVPVFTHEQLYVLSLEGIEQRL